MCSYGIGVTRLLQAIPEILLDNDNKSLVWPREINPFHVCILINKMNKKLEDFIQELCNTLSNNGINILLDDRENINFGTKLGESKIYGSEILIIFGEHYYETGEIEIENLLQNSKNKINITNPKELTNIITNIINLD